MALRSSSKSPAGLKLTKIHTVGDMIGEGAFGQVHLVLCERENQEGKWACKLVAVPAKKEKKSSLAKIAHDSLYAENLLYMAHFNHLCGSFLPARPSMTRDRLECYYNDRKVTEEIHKKLHILVDVKPDNLMIASFPDVWSDESLAANIRIVDLGLVKPFTTVGGHRPDDGTSQVQGTPLYASLHVHELHTPSRRDDIESMLYVVGEFMLIANGIVHDQPPPYGTGNKASFLPWSQEQSDEAISKVKARCVENPSSDFYSAMPDTASEILFECLTAAREMSYKKKPNYTMFRDLLRDINIPLSSQSSTPAKRSAKRASSRPLKKTKLRTKKTQEIVEIDSESDDEKATSHIDDEVCHKATSKRKPPGSSKPITKRATRSSTRGTKHLEGAM